MLAGPFFLLLVLSACSHSQQTLRLNSNSQSLPLRVELARAPFFPQQQYQCGPAALATVLGFYGVSVTPEQLKEQVYLPSRHGTLQTEIVAASRRYDMVAVELAPSIEALLSEIAAGNPVLVFQNLGLAWWPRWHFAVAIGFDLKQKEITLRSGTHRRWTTPLSVFESTWRKADYWALVIKPAGDMPATAQPTPYLKAASELEITGHAEAAYHAYRAAIERWPNNVIALMGLGNSAYMLGKHSRSIHAFKRIIKLAPARHEPWNNIAYPLAAQGCTTESRHAIECALSLAPGNTGYLQSLDEIGAIIPTGKRSESACPVLTCPVLIN